MRGLQNRSYEERLRPIESIAATAAVSIAFAKGACVCGAPRRGKVRSASSKKPEAMTSLGKLTGKA